MPLHSYNIYIANPWYSLGDRTMLAPAEVLKLLQFCLNEYYQQTFGTAMGSLVSVTVTNLVTEDAENRALSTYHSPPPFRKSVQLWRNIQYKNFKITSIQSSHPLNSLVNWNLKENWHFWDTEITHHDMKIAAWQQQFTEKRLIQTNIFHLILIIPWPARMWWQEHFF